MNKVDEAKVFLLNKVIEPALESNSVSEKSKARAQKVRQWILNSRNIGNIYDYISRFVGVDDSRYKDVYLELKSLGLTPIEDIIKPFAQKYSNYLDYRFTWEHFLLGHDYSSWDIASVSNTYNLQRGIYLVEDENENVEAILSKVGFDDGEYANKWLKDKKILKHYLYSHNGVFNQDYKVNNAIINSPNTKSPILIFEKKDKVCTYIGEFKFINLDEDETGKWFVLEKVDLIEESLEEHYQKEDKVVRGIDLADVPKGTVSTRSPRKKSVVSEVFNRSPLVVKQVLKRANGICEFCENDAPFIRASDGTPYLEVHHIIPLAEGGHDVLENTVAICPNCHRKAHFGLV